MNPNDIKNKVLQTLIEAMDERMVSNLKSKSPKFAKVDIQANDPKLAESLKDKLVVSSEDENEDPKKEMSLEDFKEDKSEGENPIKESDHTNEDDPDLEKLMELYKSLK